jgi:hypothetical protein
MKRYLVAFISIVVLAGCAPLNPALRAAASRVVVTGTDAVPDQTYRVLGMVRIGGADIYDDCAGPTPAAEPSASPPSSLVAAPAPQAPRAPAPAPPRVALAALSSGELISGRFCSRAAIVSASF